MRRLEEKTCYVQIYAIIRRNMRLRARPRHSNTGKLLGISPLGRMLTACARED